MKLSKSVIKKIIKYTLSKTDINLLIYFASKQLENGCAYNIYYKDVVDALGIAPKTFYQRMAVLESRNIIKFELSGKYGYYNIVILDNDFTNKDFSDGYVNINRDFFFTEEFLKMRASEKYVLLKVMSRNNDNLNEINASDEKIAEYANIDPKNKSLIKRIVTTLRNFNVAGQKVFDIFTSARKKNNVHFFKLVLNSKRPVSAKEEVQLHMFTNFCRKNRINYTEKDIKDLVQMDNQYRYYNAIYMSVVKEILLQYGEVKAAVIRSMVDPIVNRVSAHTFGTEEYTPLY